MPHLIHLTHNDYDIVPILFPCFFSQSIYWVWPKMRRRTNYIEPGDILLRGDTPLLLFLLSPFPLRQQNNAFPTKSMLNIVQYNILILVSNTTYLMVIHLHSYAFLRYKRFVSLGRITSLINRSSLRKHGIVVYVNGLWPHNPIQSYTMSLASIDDRWPSFAGCIIDIL